MTMFARSLAPDWQQTELFATPFAAASRARTLALPVEAPGLAAIALAFGSSISASSPKSRRAGSSLKTCQPFAVADWTRYSGASLRSGMMRSGIVYPLPPLAHHTGGIGSGSWPTPMNKPGGGSVMDGGSNSRKAARKRGMWPTPRQEDGESTGMSAERLVTREPDNLPSAVKLWRTPNTVDAKGGNRLDPSLGQTQLCHQVGGVLNPDWAEKLMGLPAGWTDIGPLPMARRAAAKTARMTATATNLPKPST